MPEVSEQIKSELRQAFDNKSLSLFLGAGVSMGSSFPSWEKLVLAMYFTKISELKMQGLRPFTNYLFAIAEWNLQTRYEPLEITARKLLKYYFDDKEGEKLFEKDLYNTLYAVFLDREMRLNQEIYPDQLRQGNRTLDAVAKLCESDPGIRSVITYNYDSLLEIALKNLLHQSIFDETILEPQKMPIYHVHGYVPLDSNLEKSKGYDIVFTEDQYHRVGGNPYNWSNLVQIQAMTNTTSLMIGLSLSDRNMRRLLDAVRRAPINNRHYALLKRPKHQTPDNETLDRIHEKAKKYFAEFQNSGIKSDLPYAPDSILYSRAGVKSSGINIKTKGPRYREEISRIIEEMRNFDRDQDTFVFEQLGIKPIWFDKFEDIPDILHSIFNFGRS